MKKITVITDSFDNAKQVFTTDKNYTVGVNPNNGILTVMIEDDVVAQFMRWENYVITDVEEAKVNESF